MEKLQWAIHVLEEREKNGKIGDSCEIRKPVNSKLQRQLVRLIGTKPLFKCMLDGIESRVLWDTGSQVSVVDMAWLSVFAPDVELLPISDFLENNENVEFLAANNTVVPMLGAVVLEFSMGQKKFPVPFVVTSGSLANPIIGFNVMTHAICSGDADTVVTSLKEAMGDVAVGTINVMVGLISDNFEDTDCVGLLRASKDVVIPPQGVVRLRCRVKGDVKGVDMSFITSAPVHGDWDDDLEVTQALGEFVRGRTPKVNVEIRNASNKPKVIKSNMVVGEISAVSAVVPVNLGRMAAEVNAVGVREGEDLPSKTAENCPKWQPEANLDHLPPDQREEIRNLLWEECELFARSDTDIGEIPDLQMEINLTDEVPVNVAYRHLPRKLYDDVKAYLNDLIINGWIQESKSEYASPIVCVRKKDGTMRLCVDYRKLNLKMIPDRHPIPRVQDLLDGLGGQKFFTTLDMAKAYHQGFVKAECQKYTAFATPWALYSWLRIPFGLKNAPAAFQRYICQSLTGLLDRVCLAYLDDILVFGKTFTEHKLNLQQVFRRLKSKGMKLRVDKCVFAKPEVRYLGRLVSEHGYRPDPEDVKALEKFRVAPANVGEVRTMLGFLSYYRGHVQNFAKLMKPVYDLVKWVDPNASKEGGKRGYDKKRKVEWSPALQAAINEVIDILRSPPVMAYPNFDLPFILNCDASSYGLGAALYQRQNEDLRVISYASRTLTGAEQNYHLHSGKLEFLALKWSVCDKFADYLGHGSTFTVYTDNNPLTYVMTTAKLNATGMRWVGELSAFDFTLKYRPGKSSGDADGLSRNPLPCPSDHCAVAKCRSCRLSNQGCPNASRLASCVSQVGSPSITELEKECTESISRQDLSVLLSSPEADYCQQVDVDQINLTSLHDLTSSSPLKLVSKEELGQKQSEDNVIGPVYEAKMVGQRPSKVAVSSWSRKSKLLLQQWNRLSVRDGVLLRKTQRYTQIVLPEQYHQVIYKELHAEMGHLSSERVECLARQRFYWPHMRGDIDFFIRKKCTCVFTKKPNVTEKAKLVPITATYPFEIVSIDFLHLDRCSGGYEYALVVCDHFTRFSQAYATKKKSARAAADKLFNQFILQWGFPTRIHHDRGPEWNNHLFAHLHRLSGIKASNTTPYHPQGDPVVERYNRTLINMLKSIPENEKKRWKDHLNKLTFAYNSTVHKSTGYSPFFLLMGRESRLRVDGAFPSFDSDTSEENPKTYTSFVTNWKRKMSEAFALANQKSGRSQQANKERYDARANSVDIGIGERVLVQKCKKSGTGKLESFWEPDVYVVVEKRPNIPVFGVRKYGASNSRVRVLHRNLLKSVNELCPPEDESSKDSNKVHRKKAKTTGRKAKERDISSVPRTELNAGGNVVVAVESSDDDEEIVAVQHYHNADGVLSTGDSGGTVVHTSGNEVSDHVGDGEQSLEAVDSDTASVVDQVESAGTGISTELLDNEPIFFTNADTVGDVVSADAEDIELLDDKPIFNYSGVGEDSVETEPENTAEESLSDEGDHENYESTSSYDSVSESPSPGHVAAPRRSARTAQPPQILTYDEIGGNPSLTSRAATQPRR